MIKNIYLRVFLLLVACSLIGYTIWDYRNEEDLRLSKSIAKGSKVSLNIKQSLDSILADTKLFCYQLSQEIGAKVTNKNSLKALLKREAKKIGFVDGITVAFEPGQYFDKDELYGIYYQQKTDNFLNVLDKYDYRNDTLETAKWYTDPMKSGKASFTQPYYGQVADELLFDYATPIFLKINGEEKIVGVLSLTITLNHLSEVARNLVKGQSGYLFLTDANGVFITHPDRSFILNHSLKDFVSSDMTDSKLSELLSKKSGYVSHLSAYTQVPSMMFFQTIDETDWKATVVYSSTDLLGDPTMKERKIIHISLAVSFAVFLILLFLLNFKKPNELWPLAIISGFVIIANIVLVWYIHLNTDFSEELSNRTRIYSTDALQAFIHDKNTELHRLGVDEYLNIPTGISINELGVDDSYNIGVSGIIWQKWPIDNDLPLKEGFKFDQAVPGGKSIFITLESKELINGDTWLYRWSFSSKLKIYFDYSQYPLDQHYIDIRLSYPDPTAAVMLVPDLNSYEVLNPSAKPGINNLLFVPKYRLIASYFSFLTTQVKTFYGKGSKLNTPEFESLEFNIVVKRRFITPFVSLVIPFVIGAGMIFFLLYSLSNDENDNSGLTVMGAVQGMAALFFGMLFSHISVRSKIQSTMITYLECFYFIAYVLIIALILIVVMFKKNPNNRILGYHDNLIIKSAYWPTLFALIYLITFLKFY